MSDDGISEDVKKFLADYINSVEQLEVLLLLQEHSSRQWSAGAVAKELYIAEESAGRRLADLTAHGLLEAAGDAAPLYRYNPSTQALHRTARELAVVYKERRVRVVSLIFSSPVDKIQTFADAFKFKKDK